MPNKTIKVTVPTSNTVHSGPDKLQRADVPLPGKVILDNVGEPVGLPLDEVTEIFDYAPGAIATNPPTARNAAMHFCKNTGVGTPTTTVSTSGGCLLTTTATDNDVTILTASAASPFATRGVVYSVNSRLRFSTQVNITALTNIVLIGLCETPSATAVTVATTGQGNNKVFFLFDPDNDLSTGITTYATNWILVQQSASGTVTYADSGVAVQAGTETLLTIHFSAALKPLFYINGVLVLTGTAWTVLVALLAQFGLRTVTAAAKTMHIRYASVSRLIG